MLRCHARRLLLYLESPSESNPFAPTPSYFFPFSLFLFPRSRANSFFSFFFFTRTLRVSRYPRDFHVVEASINLISQAANREIYGVFERTAHLPQLGQLLSFSGTSRKPANIRKRRRYDDFCSRAISLLLLLLLLLLLSFYDSSRSRLSAFLIRVVSLTLSPWRGSEKKSVAREPRMMHRDQVPRYCDLITSAARASESRITRTASSRVMSPPPPPPLPLFNALLFGAKKRTKREKRRIGIGPDGFNRSNEKEYTAFQIIQKRRLNGKQVV